MFNVVKKIMTVLAPLLLVACATMFSGSTQTVNVQAVDQDSHQLVPDAVCTITDGKGNVYPIYSNPGSAMLTRGNGALNIVCKKRGYKQMQVGVGQSFNACTVADVLFWPGAIVDACTGAAVKYPSHVTVLMKKIN